MQHLVKKQTIVLQLTRNEDAFQMQQLLSMHYWNDIVPILSSLFDELSSEEEIIQVDRVELDLGRIASIDLQQIKWNDKILSKFRDRLHDRIVGEFKKKGGLIVRETRTISICKQWLFYIEKGYLPWNFMQLNETYLVDVLEALAVDYHLVNELRRLIRSDDRVALRIGLQYSDDFLVKLMEVLTGHNQQNLSLIINGSQNILVRTEVHIPVNKSTVWSRLLTQTARSMKSLNSQELMKEVLIQNLSSIVITDLRKDDLPDECNILWPIVEQLRRDPLREKKDDTVQPKRTNETETSDLIDDDGIFVQQAGVALVHPFLSSLFKHLQLIEGGKFKSEKLQQKALWVLHYIGTGKSMADEYELTLAKILCNWPLRSPVEKDFSLSEDELTEVDKMLESVIRQWSVLRNTSVDGLREGFLRRSGKLFTKNDQLYLRVETQTIDVLLDQLPWVLSMIKLPWMKEILRVEWR